MRVKKVPYIDAWGVTRWAELSAESAAILDAFDRNMRRRSRKFFATHRLVGNWAETSDDKRRRRQHSRHSRPIALAGFLNVELEPAFRAIYPRCAAAPWEGARASFTHFVGLGSTWPPPGASIEVETQTVVRRQAGKNVCAFCGGRRLAPHQCCLGCASVGPT